MAHLVAALVLDGVAPFELGIATEVFGLRRPELGVEWYDLVVCSPRPGYVPAKGWFGLVTSHGLEALDAADTVVVPAFATMDDPAPPEALTALKRAHARGARVVSFCSGAFVLAAAGLLDGRPATTHWRYAAEFSRRYPAVRLDPAVLYVDDGDLLTSAGTAAGIDVCLHLVRRDFGAGVARSVARRMVVPPHRDGGQAQYVVAPVPRSSTPDREIQAVLDWLGRHLDRTGLTTADLARRAHLSPRTFTRRFRDVTGTTPGRWLRAQRLDRARALLETTDATVDAIAAATGFGSAVTLRHRFQQVMRVSPAAYRRVFGRTGPSG